MVFCNVTDPGFYTTPHTPRKTKTPAKPKPQMKNSHHCFPPKEPTEPCKMRRAGKTTNITGTTKGARHRGNIVAYEDLPALLRDQLGPWVSKLRVPHESHVMSGGECYDAFKYTYYHAGDQRFNVLLPPKDHLITVAVPIVGAFVLVASQLDPTLEATSGAASVWLKRMVEGGDTEAREWLSTHDPSLLETTPLAHGKVPAKYRREPPLRTLCVPLKKRPLNHIRRPPSHKKKLVDRHPVQRPGPSEGARKSKRQRAAPLNESFVYYGDDEPITFNARLARDHITRTEVLTVDAIVVHEGVVEGAVEGWRSPSPAPTVVDVPDDFSDDGEDYEEMRLEMQLAKLKTFYDAGLISHVIWEAKQKQVLGL